MRQKSGNAAVGSAKVDQAVLCVLCDLTRITLAALTIRVIPSLIKTTLKLINRPQSFVPEPEVGEKLFLVQRSNLADGLDFDDYLILYYQIGAKSQLKACPFADNWYGLLPGKVQASLL